MDGGVKALGMKALGDEGAGDEGSDGVETPSNEDGRAQGGARQAQGGARQGAGMGARRGEDDGAMMQRY